MLGRYAVEVPPVVFSTPNPTIEVIPAATATTPSETLTGDNTNTFQGTYSNEVLIVEVIELSSTDLTEVRVEVAYQHAGRKKADGKDIPTEMRRLEWWKGLASSNAILRVEKKAGWWPVVDTSFPTTINALAAYLEERFLTEVKALNPDYRNHPLFRRIDAKGFSTGAVFPLKNILQNDFQETVDSNWCRLLLLYAQPIQFVCFVLWVLTVICLIVRNIVLVRFEKWALRERRLGRRSVNSLTDSASDLVTRGKSPSDAVNDAWKWPQEHTAYLDQLLASVSLTGYIGTLYFLAISFPEASNLISSSRASMISSLSRFTLLMAGAFTTSLWSSIFFQLGAWLKTVQLTAESRQMLETEDAL